MAGDCCPAKVASAVVVVRRRRTPPPVGLLRWPGTAAFNFSSRGQRSIPTSEPPGSARVCGIAADRSVSPGWPRYFDQSLPAPAPLATLSSRGQRSSPTGGDGDIKGFGQRSSPTGGDGDIKGFGQRSNPTGRVRGNVPAHLARHVGQGHGHPPPRTSLRTSVRVANSAPFPTPFALVFPRFLCRRGGGERHRVCTIGQFLGAPGRGGQSPRFGRAAGAHSVGALELGVRGGSEFAIEVRSRRMRAALWSRRGHSLTHTRATLQVARHCRSRR